MVAVGQNLIEGHSKGPNIRGKGKLALLEALYSIPKKQKRMCFGITAVCFKPRDKFNISKINVRLPTFVFVLLNYFIFC